MIGTFICKALIWCMAGAIGLSFILIFQKDVFQIECPYHLQQVAPQLSVRNYLRFSNRQNTLKSFCLNEKNATTMSNLTAKKMVVNDRYKMLICLIPKAATTTWKRMFLMFDGVPQENVTELTKPAVHRQKFKYLFRYKESRWEHIKQNYHSFIFVRHPFERLLSTYRNKFLDPYNNIFREKYIPLIQQQLKKKANASRMSKAKKEISFADFLSFVISRPHENEHWNPFQNLCSPCSMKYDYIGKMETLVEDSEEIMRRVGVGDKFSFLENSTDKYQKKTSDLMRKYYVPLKSELVQQVYTTYRDDFRAFGYEIPKYLRRKIRDI